MPTIIKFHVLFLYETHRLHFILIYWKKDCNSLSSFLYCTLKTMKLLNDCYLLFSLTKKHSDDHLFKEYINPTVINNLQYIL